MREGVCSGYRLCTIQYLGLSCMQDRVHVKLLEKVRVKVGVKIRVRVISMDRVRTYLGLVLYQ